MIIFQYILVRIRKLKTGSFQVIPEIRLLFNYCLDVSIGEEKESIFKDNLPLIHRSDRNFNRFFFIKNFSNFIEQQ